MQTTGQKFTPKLNTKQQRMRADRSYHQPASSGVRVYRDSHHQPASSGMRVYRNSHHQPASSGMRVYRYSHQQPAFPGMSAVKRNFVNKNSSQNVTFASELWSVSRSPGRPGVSGPWVTVMGSVSTPPISLRGFSEAPLKNPSGNSPKSIKHHACEYQKWKMKE